MKQLKKIFAQVLFRYELLDPGPLDRKLHASEIVYNLEPRRQANLVLKIVKVQNEHAVKFTASTWRQRLATTWMFARLAVRMLVLGACQLRFRK